MRLAAFVESKNHVCCRYRLSAFRTHLAQAGHALDLHDLPNGLWGRWRIGVDAEGADIVIVQRKLLSSMELGLLRRRAKHLIFDYDDAVWLRDSYSSKGFENARRRKRFQAILDQCDAVVAGNAFLAEHAEKWRPNCPVFLIPTCVDVDRYSLSHHSRTMGNAELVWIGSSSTLHGLERIQPTLERIGKVNPHVRLKLICDRFLKLKNLKVIECPWSEKSEAVEIASADIGISWIPDDLWSRGKCGLKVLQYMAAGLPVVANPVGVQVEMVRHGETGFLAHTDEEWADAIHALSADSDLRRRMGEAGRRLVEQKYSVESGSRCWISLLHQTGRQRVPA